MLVGPLERTSTGGIKRTAPGDGGGSGEGRQVVVGGGKPQNARAGGDKKKEVAGRLIAGRGNRPKWMPESSTVNDRHHRSRRRWHRWHR